MHVNYIKTDTAYYIYEQFGSIIISPCTFAQHVSSTQNMSFLVVGCETYSNQVFSDFIEKWYDWLQMFEFGKESVRLRHPLILPHNILQIEAARFFRFAALAIPVNCQSLARVMWPHSASFFWNIPCFR